MSTLKEVEVLLRKVKKENRELKKAIEEKDLHIKFLNERLDNWADKNALLREEKLKITVDDVIAFQKAKAEYASSQNRSLTEQLEKQEKVELDGNLSGRTVKLNKPMKGDVKKFKVFVKDGDKVKKINFGDPNMSIKKNSPARKKSYCARSGGIKGKNNKLSANYWSRKMWNC